jgi:hypothetical protein
VTGQLFGVVIMALAFFAVTVGASYIYALTAEGAEWEPDSKREWPSSVP